MAPERSKKKSAKQINQYQVSLNSKKSYEILITEKLEQLPVPDMADAIWARIELQLDAAPGTDADTSPTSVTKPAKIVSAKTMAIIAGGIITIIILIFLLKRNAKKPEKIKEPPPTQSNVKIDGNISVPGSVNKTGSFTQPELPQNNIVKPAPVLSPGNIPGSKNDSLFIQSLPVTTKDSNRSMITAPIFSPVIDSFSVVPPPFKKPKGVKGITDADYKILGGKKDSLIKKGG